MKNNTKKIHEMDQSGLANRQVFIYRHNSNKRNAVTIDMQTGNSPACAITVH